MVGNRILGTIAAILNNILALARTRLGSSKQPPAVLLPTVVPVMSGKMELRASQVLPGQMIIPLAWPVNEQNSPQSQKG